MQINQDLDAILLRPLNGLEEVRILALDVRLAAGDIKGPVADWNTDMVQALSQKLINVR